MRNARPLAEMTRARLEKIQRGIAELQLIQQVTLATAGETLGIPATGWDYDPAAMEFFEVAPPAQPEAEATA